jgi:hypothetical protein
MTFLNVVTTYETTEHISLTDSKIQTLRAARYESEAATQNEVETNINSVRGRLGETESIL